MTDGTAEYNADHYRVSSFYDLAKTSVIRLALAAGAGAGDHGGTAVALTPGWLRSETMLEHYGVTRGRTGATATERTPHFSISETPRFVGRAVAALAADPEVARWNGQSLSSGQLAQVYGFTDLDGTRPDGWRYLVEVQDAGLPADDTGYPLSEPPADVEIGDPAASYRMRPQNESGESHPAGGARCPSTHC